MIVDKLENLEKYLCKLGKNFAAAAAFVRTHDLYALPNGQTDVDGENAFVIAGEELYHRDEMFWEAHKRYADVQIVLSGSERFGWGSQVTFGDLRDDYLPCTDVAGFDFTLHEGQFVIFLPLEPHSPCNPAGDGRPCRKAIIKVLVE